jgi:hypothetical protein
MDQFDGIPGGEAGEPSGWDATRRTLKVPARVLGAGATGINPGFDPPTHKASAGQASESTPKSVKLIGAPWVARLFGWFSVALTRGDRSGSSPLRSRLEPAKNTQQCRTWVFMRWFQR